MTPPARNIYSIITESCLEVVHSLLAYSQHSDSAVYLMVEITELRHIIFLEVIELLVAGKQQLLQNVSVHGLLSAVNGPKHSVIIVFLLREAQFNNFP